MATRPEDRYPSCLALADDVERWAADEPVSVYRAPAHGTGGPLGAQAPHRRRHRGGAAPDGGGRPGRQHGPARPVAGADRSRAAGRRVGQARAQAINNFLVNDLLGQADPERNPAGADVTVRQLLDRAAKSVAAAESSPASPACKERSAPPSAMPTSSWASTRRPPSNSTGQPISCSWAMPRRKTSSSPTTAPSGPTQ